MIEGKLEDNIMYTQGLKKKRETSGNADEGKSSLSRSFERSSGRSGLMADGRGGRTSWSTTCDGDKGAVGCGGGGLDAAGSAPSGFNQGEGFGVGTVDTEAENGVNSRTIWRRWLHNGYN